MTQQKIGVLGGSFDPIHFGHLNLAINMLESAGLDRVIFSLTPLSPFKESKPPMVSFEHRLAMLKLATSGVAFFDVIDSEKAAPSYTIDTIRKLKENSTDTFHLIIGDDHLSTFHEWKDAEALISLAPPLIASRETQQILRLPSLPSQFLEIVQKGRFKTPVMEISSTQIRERLRQKKYCGHLVPSNVLNYIKEKNIYM